MASTRRPALRSPELEAKAIAAGRRPVVAPGALALATPKAPELAKCPTCGLTSFQPGDVVQAKRFTLVNDSEGKLG